MFGVGESHGLHYYTIQFIEGEGLDHVLRQIQRMWREEGISIYGQELTALSRSQFVSRVPPLEAAKFAVHPQE